MTQKANVGVEFSAVLKLIGDKLYTTSNAFIRENVQNAIDALRLTKLDGRINESQSRVEVRTSSRRIEIEDWGVGMSAKDLRDFYFKIGSSSKNNAAAAACNVIGKFGIGAFANFGVCSTLELHSWRKGNTQVNCRLSRRDLEKNETSYDIEDGHRLDHLGTLVIGEEKKIDEQQLEKTLTAHVGFLPEKIYFNGNLISGKEFAVPENGPKLATCHVVADSMEAEAIFCRIDDDLQVTLIPKNSEKWIEGLIVPKAGELTVFVNKFLVSTGASSSAAYFFKKHLPFAGFIDTNILQPNVAREGLDYASQERLSAFLEKLTEITIEIMKKEEMLFVRPELAKYVVRYASENLGALRVRQFGRKNLVKIEDVIKNHERSGAKIMTTTAEPPIEIASWLRSRAYFL